MDTLSLAVPSPIQDALPEDGDDAGHDMVRAVDGWETRLNEAIRAAESDEEAAGAVLDILERFESRWEQYDEYVVELRAWGQSPIYAMAWRDLYAALVRQVYAHDELADRLNRERHARLLDDGIRPN